VGIGLWAILSAAATNIPWTKVAQNTPLLVDLLGKAKTRMRLHDASQKNLADEVRLLQDENARLDAALLQLSEKLVKLTSRVALLQKTAVVSLLLGVSAVVLWLLK
jgi:hypothetical protein